MSAISEFPDNITGTEGLSAKAKPAATPKAKAKTVVNIEHMPVAAKERSSQEACRRDEG